MFTEVGGAEVLILATNTMHKVAPAIRAAITIPFVDIFSATAEAVVGAVRSQALIRCLLFKGLF